MEISLLQAFALGIIAFIAGLDMFNGLTHMHRPVVLGPLVGLVLGDLHTGILTGGTLELVWMGLAPLAGAQPPNVIIGTIVGTAFAITTGVKPDVAVGVAVPFAVAVQMGITFLFSVMSGVMSRCDWQQTRAAFDAGADGLVHCYNGMTGLHHREPGMVGAGLTDKRAWLELIADGHHVHPAAMSLCCCCAKERIVLITDAMQAAGMPDGRYTLCGEEVQMHGGVVRTASGGLAGSTLSVDAAVRNMVELTGVTPAEAIHMASLHPARMLGVDGVLGSLKPGKRASVVALDSGLHVQQIWIQGQLASF